MGDAPDRLYLVLEGQARVSTTADGQETDRTELLPGQLFGELAILKDQPRTASVRAVVLSASRGDTGSLGTAQPSAAGGQQGRQQGGIGLHGVALY